MQLFFPKFVKSSLQAVPTLTQKITNVVPTYMTFLAYLCTSGDCFALVDCLEQLHLHEF